MRSIHIDLEVSNLEDMDVCETVRALVDTGATLSVMPSSLLDRLGVRRLERRRFQGFGGVVTRETGGVIMRHAGSSGAVTVVFGAEDDPPIMGVTALGALGFEADPVSGRLKPVDLLLL